jgi:hypothetical protein
MPFLFRGAHEVILLRGLAISHAHGLICFGARHSVHPHIDNIGTEQNKTKQNQHIRSIPGRQDRVCRGQGLWQGGLVCE